MKLKDKIALIATTSIITCIIMTVAIDNKEFKNNKLTDTIYVTYGTAFEDYGDEFLNDDGSFIISDPPEFKEGEEVMLVMHTNNTEDISDDFIIYVDNK